MYHNRVSSVTVKVPVVRWCIGAYKGSITDNGILNSNPLEVRLIANLWLLASNLGEHARACGDGGDGEM